MKQDSHPEPFRRQPVEADQARNPRNIAFHQHDTVEEANSSCAVAGRPEIESQCKRRKYAQTTAGCSLTRGYSIVSWPRFIPTMAGNSAELVRQHEQPELSRAIRRKAKAWLVGQSPLM